MPTGFKEDRWVKEDGGSSGNRAVVHHANIYIRHSVRNGCGSIRWGSFVPQSKRPALQAGAGLIDESGAGYTPGKQTVVRAADQAKLVPAGADIVFQMHYTANGKDGRDRTKLGLIFSKTPPAERVARIKAANATFAIPPGAADYRVDGSVTLLADAELVSLKPHMHLRGSGWSSARYTPQAKRKRC